ncbi:MAG: transcriptional regulator, partial [Actinomycetota bacterium]|nr:transcriptional regulator [Actinomycetota bacterium]
ARAEREVLVEELAEDSSADDPMAHVRRLVTFRLRRAVDRVAGTHPDLGRHLRYSVRTGTFCAYDPPAGTTWES